MTATSNAKLATVNRPLWWIGWRPVVTPVVGGGAGLAVGNAVAIPALALVGLHPLVTMAVSTITGVCVGAAGWYLGTREVNHQYRDVLDMYRSGVSSPDVDETTYVLLTGGAGTKPLVTPHRNYRTTYVVLRESTIALSSGGLDLSTRRLTVDGDATEVAYEDVAHVSSEHSALRIRTTDGDEFRYVSLSEPRALLGDLRNRLQSVD